MVISGDKTSTNNEIVAGKTDMGGIKVGTKDNTGHTLTMNNVNKVSGFGRSDENGGFINVSKDSTATVDVANGGTIFEGIKANIGGVFVNTSEHTINLNGKDQAHITFTNNTAEQAGVGANVAAKAGQGIGNLGQDSNATTNINFVDNDPASASYNKLTDESLTEASLSYHDQLIKMSQWHNGVRGANIASMSDAKLKLN